MMREVYLDSIGTALGAHRDSVDQAVAGDRTRSEAAAFHEAGFRFHHRAAAGQDSFDLARAAVASMDTDVSAVDAVLYSTCLPQNGNLGDPGRFETTRDVKNLMDFPVCRLQAEWGMERAQLFGIHQQACTGLIGALRMAQWMLRAEPSMQSALCLTADRFPEGALYEQAYNLISDGAAACRVGVEPRGWKIVGGHGLANGALAQADDDETVGTFFNLSHRVITETIERLGLTLDSIDWVVAQNTNRHAWPILARLLRIDPERVVMPTLPDTGHMISGDNLLNLAALEASGRVRSGQKALLFMAGYGLHWQALVLEKV